MFNENAKLKGIVEIRLVDKCGKPKKIFQENLLWKMLNKTLKVDIRIPYITGYQTFVASRHNLVVTKGKEIAAKQLNGVTTTPVTAIAIGTGTTSPAAGNTASRR